MITINTNKNNISTLKLIIAALYSEKNVTINFVNGVTDKEVRSPRRLPYFEVEDVPIFSPNAGTLYFIPSNEGNRKTVNEWLEWECTVLCPVLAFLFGTTWKTPQVKEKLASCLKKIDSTLASHKYLSSDSFSADDATIWSTLYPLVKSEKLRKDYLTDHSALLKWFTSIEAENFAIKALQIYEVKADQEAYVKLYNTKIYCSEMVSELITTSPDQLKENLSLEELSNAKESWTKFSTCLKERQIKSKPVLPQKGKENVLITSALPYVNNVPHLGNIIGCVLSADVFARYSRLRDRNVLFICGTDEYGTATETKALEENLTCQQICDKYFEIHDAIYKWFGISFDKFGRTSTPQQTELCQEMFLRLNDNGFMFTESVEQLRCEKCQRFLADRFVEGGCPNVGCTYEDARGDQCDGCGKLVNAIELKNPRCKICGDRPKIERSSQFFMDLPKLEPLLLHWFKKSSPGWSPNAQTIGRAWLKEGLKPRCITRDLKWGIPVPLNGYRDKVFYVWFDAPIGYMSITKNYTDRWEEWWKPAPDRQVTLYQFLGKDNVLFHSIMFPAMLLGCNRGYVTVSHIMATEYLNYEDGKFSKSRGVGVFGTDAQDTGIPKDVWRFYLLYVRPESQDSNFNWTDLATKNNSELLNNLGNFINRALMFAKNSFGKVVPKMVLNEEDYTLLANCNRELKGYVEALEKAKLRDGIRHILAISKHGNQYMQSNQPWVLLKGNEGEKERAGTVIGVCCNVVCLISIILSPYMPDTADKIRKQINAKEYVLSDECITKYLPDGHQLGEPYPLFTKIELSKIEELKQKFAGKQADSNNSNGAPPKETEIPTDKDSLQKMVDSQAALVRKLKEGGAEKSVWQPEVTKLLALKTKLQEASTDKTVVNGHNENPKILEDEIAKQGLVVRKLKEGGAEKSVWQPEVAKLLSLKEKLAGLTGVAVSQPKGKKGKK